MSGLVCRHGLIRGPPSFCWVFLGFPGGRSGDFLWGSSLHNLPSQHQRHRRQPPLRRVHGRGARLSVRAVQPPGGVRGVRGGAGGGVDGVSDVPGADRPAAEHRGDRGV